MIRNTWFIMNDVISPLKPSMRSSNEPSNMEKFKVRFSFNDCFWGFFSFGLISWVPQKNYHIPLFFRIKTKLEFNIIILITMIIRICINCVYLKHTTSDIDNSKRPNSCKSWIEDLEYNSVQRVDIRIIKKTSWKNNTNQMNVQGWTQTISNRMTKCS